MTWYRRDLGIRVMSPCSVEVVVQHLIEEEDPPGQRGVQHLGQGELGLQQGQFVAVAGGLVVVGEPVGPVPQPRAQQRIDRDRRS